MRKDRLFLLKLCVAFLLAASFYESGIGGCGGGSGGGGGGGGTGVNVNSVSDIPSLNISDYYDTGSGGAGLMAAFKAQGSGSGGFCKEFCYNKQCLMETLRHSVEVEFNLCMLRKAKEATEGTFDFPSSGCAEFTILPPEFEGEEFGEEGPPAGGPPTVKAKTIAAETPPSDFIIRLCTDGNTRKMHHCEGGSLVNELILTNETSGGISATVTNRFSFGEECTDTGKMNIASNCNADAFTNPECVADFDATFNGCFGAGTINFAVTGGTTRSYDLEASFAAGGAAGEEEFGSFSADVKALWDVGGTGTFKSVGSGSFPAIPASEISLSDLRGCEALASSGATAYCHNDNFDPESFDPAIPFCPFVAASGTTCTFDFSDVQCCTISGSTLVEQEGTIAEDSVCGEQFTTVSEFPFPEQSTEVNFEEAYGCDPSSPTAVDLSNTTTDFSECFALFEDLMEVQAEANCEEQGAKEGIEDIGEAYEEGGSCTSDAECGEGEFCEIFEEEETEGFCVRPPPSCTTDEDCVDQCFEDEACVCVPIPDFGDHVCVPAFTCESDFDCPPNAMCVEGQCEFQEENPLLL